MIALRGETDMKPVRFEISNTTSLATIPSVPGVYLFRDPN